MDMSELYQCHPNQEVDENHDAFEYAALDHQHHVWAYYETNTEIPF